MNDRLFRLEQVQTRLRIEAAQFRFWVGQAVFLWIAAAALIFAFGCREPAQKQHLVTWVWSSVTPLKYVTWQGERYNPRELAAWMDARVYHSTFKDWAMRSMLLGLLPIGGLAFLGLRHLRKQEDATKHIRGAELIPIADLQKRLSKAGAAGLTIAGVQIPQELECQHVSICGATGTGKSVAIRHILRQIAARRESCLVFSPKDAFVQEFYTPARRDHILSLFDRRCSTWTPWAEGEKPYELQAQGASLFPVVPGMNGTTAYYHREAAKYYCEILETLQSRDPRMIPTVIESMVPKGIANRAGIVQTLELGCQSFRYLEAGEREWSAKKWVEQADGSWVFLTFREDQTVAALPIVSLWLESVTRQLLMRPLGATPTIWIVIDELASLQAQPTLEDLLNKGREYGVAVVIGFQNILKLNALYGSNITSSMMSTQATRLYLAARDSETQEWAAKNIGEREVIVPVESESVGAENVRDAIHRSHQRRIEAAVLNAEFGQLKDLHGILKIAHYGAARVHVPYVGLQARQPAFIARETGAVEKGKASEEKKIVRRERRAL